MKLPIRNLILLTVLGLLALLSSGCLLKFAFGNINAEFPGGDLIASFEVATDMATCVIDSDEGPTFITCTYWLDLDDGSFTAISTAQLISELGLFGLVIDPLILQVPSDATNVVATFDDGTGERAVVITEVNSFLAQPGVEVSAETGQKFLILDFPPDVPPTITGTDPTEGVPFDFSMQFNLPPSTPTPVGIKAMYTGKVEIGQQVFYMPLFPCTTNFSTIPALQIYESSIPFPLHYDILSLILSSGDLSCDGEVYDFSDVEVNICGDQNADGEVTVEDAIIDLQIITGLITPTAAQLTLSDVVPDGQIDIFDAILILWHIVGLTEITECGLPA